MYFRVVWLDLFHYTWQFTWFLLVVGVGRGCSVSFCVVFTGRCSIPAFLEKMVVVLYCWMIYYYGDLKIFSLDFGESEIFPQTPQLAFDSS